MKRITVLLFLITILSFKGWGQSEGDYRSHQNGSWNSINTWEKYVSGTWVYPAPEYPPLAPAYFTSKVSVLNGHSVTVSTANVLGTSGAILEISSGGTLNMGSYAITGFRTFFQPPQNFPTLIIDGTLNTAAHVSAINFTVGSTGYFNTSYISTTGWWSSIAPTSVTLSGTIEFSGAEGQMIPEFPYTNVTVSGSDSKYLGGTITISNLFNINSGAIIRTNGQSLTISGPGIQNSGQFLATSGGVVTFSGVAQSISGTGSYSFPVLNISSTATTTLNASISVIGLLTINNTTSNTTLNINGNTVTLYGSGILINGILSDSQGTGTFSMNTGSQNINGANPAITFPNLTIAGTSSTTLQTNITITGLLTINSGRTFYLNGKGLFLTGPGILLNGTFNDTNTGAVYFDGGTQTISGTGSFSNQIYGIAIGLFSPSNITLSVSNMLKVAVLYIESNSSLAIGSNLKVDVTTGLDIYTDHGLVLQSSASSTASLIITGQFPYYEGGQKTKVERYMLGNKWQIVSPSVTNQGIQPFFTSNPAIPTNGTNKGMAIFDEPSHEWIYYTTSTTGSLSAGTAYLTRTTGDGAIYFSGTLSYQNKLVPVSHLLYGWNCIGNPFTSAIGITSDALSTENFLAVNASRFSPSYGAVYIWDEGVPRISGTNYYRIICNSGFVPPSGTKTQIDRDYVQSGQGFLVRVNTGESSFSLTKAMQYHASSTTFFKESKGESWPGIRLYMKSGEKSSYTDIGFHQNMTRGLDFTYDAGYMGIGAGFGLFTRLVEDNGTDFGIQCLPDMESEDMVIPVGLVCNDAAVVTFTSEIVPLPNGYSAILEDRQLGIITDLTSPNAKYEVPLPANTSGIGRFFLHTKGSVTGGNEENLRKIFTFAVGKEIFIKGSVSENTFAVLYDLCGRNLKTVRLEPSEINSFRVDELKRGIYILKVSGKTLQLSNRIFIE